MKKLTLYSFYILLFYGCSDYSKDLGGGYTYMHEGGGYNVIYHQYPAKGGEIPPTVVEYKYDKNHITAKQIPDSTSIAMGYYKKNRYDRGLNENYYWIIIKKEQKVLGPFDINQFNQKQKEYNVSNKLEID